MAMAMVVHRVGAWQPAHLPHSGRMGGTMRRTGSDVTTDRSAELFSRAVKVIPGGVNSPVRAFGGVGGSPRFIARGEGAFLEDADGRRYLDYVQSWGALLFGHARKEIVAAAVEAARRGT